VSRLSSMIVPALQAGILPLTIDGGTITTNSHSASPPREFD
jgi:hypothetical protein